MRAAIRLGDRRKRQIILKSTALLPKPMRIAARYRMLANLEIAKARRGKAFIIGHPKTGNTWLRTMISRAYQVKYDLPTSLVLKSDELANADPRIPRFCVTNGFYSYESAIKDLLVAEPLLPEIGAKKVVLLVRHPCDIAVSWYLQFTQRTSPPKRELINAMLQRPIDHTTISRWDFVMHSEIGLRSIIDFLNDWERTVQRLPHHLIVHYEDLRQRPLPTLKTIMSFIEEPFSEAQIEEAVNFGAFDNLRELEASGAFRHGGMSSRKVKSNDTRKVRRGKIHGYRDDFTPEQVVEIDALVAARLSPTLVYTPLPGNPPVPAAGERIRASG